MLCSNKAVAQFTGGNSGIFNGLFRQFREFFITFYKAYPLKPLYLLTILSTFLTAETGESCWQSDKL
jgi:hypothetical protein